MVWEYIKLMVFRLLENEYESQKIESRDFYSRSLKAKLSTGSYYELSQAEGNYLLPQSLSPPLHIRERENCKMSSFAQYL